MAGGALLLVVVAALALFGGDLLPGRSAGTAASQPGAGETITVTRGDLAASATAGGRVVAQRSAALALSATGRVQTVYVEAGDEVQAGDPLVQLETGALQRAVASAEESVAVQQANLDSLLAGPRAADLAAAQAAVSSARAQLEELLDGPNPQEVAAAEANLRAAQANVNRASRQLSQTQAPANDAALLQARANVADAQEAVQEAERAHIRLLDCEQLESGEWECVPGDIPFMSAEDEAQMVRQAELRVVQARETLAAAQAELQRLEQGGDEFAVGASQASLAQMAAQRDAVQANLDLLLAGPAEAEIAQAEASLADAEAALAQLQAGPTEAAIAQAEAQLAQAEIALQRARRNLEESTLRAPFDGVVTALYVSEGETAGGMVVDLVDLQSLEVLLDVDEVDVGQLEVGQGAMVTLEAWPDEELQSEIVSIAPVANSLVLNDSLASFRVRLALPETELDVRAGMTADASLQVARREDVLLVPNRAVIADREAGRYYVTLVVTAEDGGESLERVEVTIGLRDARYTEITSGLAEGDRVRISPLVQQNDFFGGPPEGGGPFGGGSDNQGGGP